MCILWLDSGKANHHKLFRLYKEVTFIRQNKEEEWEKFLKKGTNHLSCCHFFPLVLMPFSALPVFEVFLHYTALAVWALVHRKLYVVMVVSLSWSLLENQWTTQTKYPTVYSRVIVKAVQSFQSVLGTLSSEKKELSYLYYTVMFWKPE